MSDNLQKESSSAELTAQEVQELYNRVEESQRVAYKEGFKSGFRQGFQKGFEKACEATGTGIVDLAHPS
jgi:flagellar biosynthesis/type III secretory pathway protein FliH